MKALIIVDLQRDFIDGSLAVPGAETVAENVAKYLEDISYRPTNVNQVSDDTYSDVVASMDAHVKPGAHFVDWPKHCVFGTDGFELDRALQFCGVDLHLFFKGANEAAYSAFEGRDVFGASLESHLRQLFVRSVDICGLATDYCVEATALDAVRLGFATTVLTDMVAAVADDTGAAAVAAMTAAGVSFREGR